MSGQGYRSYEKRLGEYQSLRSAGTDDGERRRAEEERAERLRNSRSAIDSGEVTRPPPVRDTRQDYDRRAVRRAITAPSPAAKRLYIVLVDNSGSNRKIADHFKQSSGHLLAMLRLIDPEGQVACIYFSDHCDGDRLMQEVDYVTPGPEGVRTMVSTLEHVSAATGGDDPEAIECALWRACDLDFGTVAKEHRHLYLVTDVVAHGMGMAGDHGCPEQRDWRKSVARVGQTFGSFEVVGCGEDPRAAQLQEQFVAPGRLAYDLIDLSGIPEERHRQAITGNALLFLIARSLGAQAVKAFLMALYEKWLTEPVFGKKTVAAAQEAIHRFAKYLELGQAEVDKLMASVFA